MGRTETAPDTEVPPAEHEVPQEPKPEDKMDIEPETLPISEEQTAPVTEVAVPEPLEAAPEEKSPPVVLVSDPTGNIRYYDKSQIFDTVGVDTIYVDIDLRSTFKFDQGRNLWVLMNSLEVMRRIEEIDETELGRQQDTGKGIAVAPVV